MFYGSVSACVSLCLWITALMSVGSVCARKQDDSFFTGSIYRARCASRCLSLHITRISAFFKHSQVRTRGKLQFPGWSDKYAASSNFLKINAFPAANDPPPIPSQTCSPAPSPQEQVVNGAEILSQLSGTITDREIRASLKERYHRSRQPHMSAHRLVCELAALISSQPSPLRSDHTLRSVGKSGFCFVFSSFESPPVMPPSSDDYMKS